MPEELQIPLFPLNLVLFPQEVLPLHIFEERYKEMIARCLADSSPFGVVAMIDEAMSSVGTTARVSQVLREYEDGRYDIESVGQSRFMIEATNDEESYLSGEVNVLDEDDLAISVSAREQVIALHMKLLELVGEQIRPSLYVDEPLLAFRIAPTAGMDLQSRQKLLEIDKEEMRVQLLIDHLQRLIPQVRAAGERLQRIQSNGHFKEV